MSQDTQTEAPQVTPLLLTITEYAERKGVPRATVTTAVRDGRIEANIYPLINQDLRIDWNVYKYMVFKVRMDRRNPKKDAEIANHKSEKEKSKVAREERKAKRKKEMEERKASRKKKETK